jgi:hypothetical protein
MLKPHLILLFLLASCALFEPQSKVRAGTLFQTGQPAYDDYFTKVHALQAEVAGFADDKKAARRGVIDALKIATDSVDVTLLEATHERMVAVAHTVGATRIDLHEDDAKVILAAESRADLPTRDFVHAVQAMLDGEMKRKRALRDVPQRCDELAKVGRDLEPRVKDDFFRQGGTMMADVHDEIAASIDVLDQISKTARLERRETEDFIADLGRAVASDQGDFTRPEATTATAGKGTRPKPQAVATTVVATTPVAKPKPPPPKPSGGGGDDFNP